LKLLRDLGEENTAVIVKRWYGGEDLGPVRFTYIGTAGNAPPSHNFFSGKHTLFTKKIKFQNNKTNKK
jgi:hypothetical protein